MTRPTVAISGPPGLTRDLVEHVVHRTQCASSDLTSAQVRVLVDPNESDVAQLSNGGSIVVVVSSSVSPDRAATLYDSGADVIVHAGSAPDELRQAITEVIERSDPPIGSDASDPGPLTEGELAILRSIDAGASVKQTARALGVTVKTVENRQGRLFRKLGVRNRAQAVTRAHALGLLDTGTGSRTPSH